MDLLDVDEEDDDDRPNKFDKMFTDCGVAFLKGTLASVVLGGGGRGGGIFFAGAIVSNGESSQFVVGVYRWGFPGPAEMGGGAGAGRDGTDVVVRFCIWNRRRRW